VKLTAKNAEVVFIGEATFVATPSMPAMERRVEFRLAESFIGQPPPIVHARWLQPDSIPASCQESGWFNTPRIIAAGGTYIVYVAADGRLLRAAGVQSRGEQNLSLDEEKRALLADGT
jgi:hypothetical protein